MVSGGEDNGNGRITNADRLARIETKLDYLLELIPRVSALEQGGAIRETSLKAAEDCLNEHDEKIEALQQSDKRFGIVGVIAGAVAGVLTGWFKP